MMKFLHALTIFSTIGIALARDFFLKVGFHADYPAIGAIGLGITTMLIFRGIVPVIGVALLAIMFTFPEEMLSSMYLDRDILLAVALTIILFPWLYKIIRDS